MNPFERLGRACGRWWTRWWVPRPEYDATFARLLEAESRLQLTRQTLRDAEARLAQHVKASSLIKARAVSGDFDSLHGIDGARLLRLEIAIDRRTIFEAVSSIVVRDAVADEAAYKMKQAVLALDFALAASVVQEVRT